MSLVYRHGERTPINPYPTDPYKDKKFWPIGFGQLTDKVKMKRYYIMVSLMAFRGCFGEGLFYDLILV